MTVARTARYALLGDSRPHDLAEIWFVCHGYRQLAARFLENFRPLDDGSRLIIAPEALNRFYLDDGSGPHGPESRVGATWMTREDRETEIRDYVAYLDTLYSRILAPQGLDPGARLNERSLVAPESGRERVAREDVEVRVLGFSQGAATVSRWAAYGHARIDHLILWAGLPAHDLDVPAAAERLAGMDVTLVAGTEDSFTSPARAEREVAELDGAGIAARLVTFNGGHRLDEDTLERLASE